MTVTQGIAKGIADATILFGLATILHYFMVYFLYCRSVCLGFISVIKRDTTTRSAHCKTHNYSYAHCLYGIGLFLSSTTHPKYPISNKAIIGDLFQMDISKNLLIAISCGIHIIIVVLLQNQSQMLIYIRQSTSENLSTSISCILHIVIII